LNNKHYICDMRYYVYKLVNTKDEVEYIGETTNPRVRFSNHRNKYGKFSGREDLEMVVIEYFDTRKEAYLKQIELQVNIGLTTDRQRMSRPGEENPKTKLTNDQVREIKRDYKKGNGAELGRKHGVSRMVIGKIMNGASFKDIV